MSSFKMVLTQRRCELKCSVYMSKSDFAAVSTHFTGLIRRNFVSIFEWKTNANYAQKPANCAELLFHATKIRFGAFQNTIRTHLPEIGINR